jgi:hypothetical protein
MTVADPLLWHASGTATLVLGRRSEGGGHAINRYVQLPDRTTRRGHAAFAGWCSSVARCCSLRSKLRSRGGSPAPCVDRQGGEPT